MRISQWYIMQTKGHLLSDMICSIFDNICERSQSFNYTARRAERCVVHFNSCIIHIQTSYMYDVLPYVALIEILIYLL